MAIPAAAAAAYQAISTIGMSSGAGASAASATSAANIGGIGAQNFGDFLSNAVKDSVSTLKQGEAMSMKQIAGQADVLDVVNAVNQAELTLNTVVAVRDKVIQAYQSIMQMPI